MIYRLSLLILICLFSARCHRKPKEARDQASYSIGVQFGRSLKAQKLDLNPALVSEGLTDVLTGTRLGLTDAEMQTAIARLSQTQQDQQKAEAVKAKVGADEFIASNARIEGVKTTKSGLQYRVHKEGTGPSPGIDDTVVVNYRGTLIDGTEFDSSYARNAPAEFPIRGVIPGWTEGLRLMKKGGSATFYVPPSLGYGDHARQQIPANAVLIFDVELLEVKPTRKPVR